ncbi:MAG: extracellular solute-binding protein [Caldilineaceae bacterium]|nr:extracellular solute-binding protein [Caldilineaceae bacterium]
MKSIRIVCLLSVLLVLFTVSITASAQDKPFEGTTVNILSFAGPQVTEPLLRRGPDFEELTGANIEVTTVPFADLYNAILTDQTTGTNSYDAFVMSPQWNADFVAAGILEDLTDDVANDPDIMWDDIALFFRNYIATYNGNIYVVPLDGDFHMIYYRTDLFEDAGMEAPRTWEEYLAAAEQFNGQDLNGDGEADYGSCIPKVRQGQSFWWIVDFASGRLQSQGTGQGLFFDQDTFNPLFGPNPAFIKALELFNQTTQYGPPDELTLDLNSTRDLFLTGRCALSIDWGDIGALSIDPERSTMQDKVGAAIIPGSTEVLDRSTGELVACDATTCPYAIDGVNYAPFAAFGGWGGGVSAAADDDVKAAAYAFFSYLDQPAQSNVDVTIGASGYNPYRLSQTTSTDPWIEAGFSEIAAQNYLSAIEDSLSSPNMVLDLSIPATNRYLQVVLDTVVSQYLAGEYTAEEAAQAIFDQWNEISDEVGRDAQHAAYLASLGISTSE